MTAPGAGKFCETMQPWALLYEYMGEKGLTPGAAMGKILKNSPIDIETPQKIKYTILYKQIELISSSINWNLPVR